jgi:hypothetical protein
MTKSMLLAVSVVGLAAMCSAALAKPAHCFTTDDGYYDCDFRGLDQAGSFTIKAAGYPTYTIEMEKAGFGFGYADFGSGNVSLPGHYTRNRNDGACWDNSETNTQICAW